MPKKRITSISVGCFRIKIPLTGKVRPFFRNDPKIPFRRVRLIVSAAKYKRADRRSRYSLWLLCIKAATPQGLPSGVLHIPATDRQNPPLLKPINELLLLTHGRRDVLRQAIHPQLLTVLLINSRLQRAYAEKSLALRFDFFDVMRYNKAKRKRILQYIQRQRYNFGGLGHGNRSARTAAKNFF